MRLALCIILWMGIQTVAADDVSTAQPQGLRSHSPSTFLLRNAHVVVRPGVELENADILVVDRKISVVGAGLVAPAEAQVVDCSDKTIYAGFVDAYVEQSVSTEPIESGAPYWNEAIRPQLRVARQLDVNSLNQSTRRKQGFTSVLAAPDGGILKGSGSVILLTGKPASEAILRPDATQHIKLTVQRGRGRSPNSPMGAVALARQAFYDAKWYDSAWSVAKEDPTLERPEQNDALDALNLDLADDRLFIADTTNELMFLRADRFAREFGLELAVLGSGNEYRRLNEIAGTGRAVILPVDYPKPPNVGTIETAMNASLEDLMHWDLAPENPARLEKSGVTFAFTTNGLDSPSKFLEGLRTAVNRGLTRDRALSALTVIPAELFGVDDQVGTIEQGKLANLVITDGDLFEKKSKVVETWVAGQRFEFDRPSDREVTGEWTLSIVDPSDAESVEQWKLSISERKEKLSGELSRPEEMEEVPDDQVSDSNADAPPEDETEEISDDDPNAASEEKDSSQEESDEDKKIFKLTKLILNGTRLSGTFLSYDKPTPGVVRWTMVIDKDGNTGSGHILYPDATKKTFTGERSPSEENSSDTSESEDDESEESDDEEEDLSSSFAVNYPLGAYGVDEVVSTSEKVALVGATIWTSGPEGIIQNGTLLIDGGKIVAVGAYVPIDRNTRTVDATGMHITPGLIDCHSHMATDGGVNESGQAITAEVRIGDFIDCDDINIYRQLAGGVTTSNILHGSANPIGGQNQVIKLRWGMNDEQLKFREAPAGIKFALGENVKQSNWGDDHTSRYPQTRMGVEQIFIDEFRAAQEYAQRQEQYRRDREGIPPRRDLELDAIAEILAGDRWIHCHSYRQDEILAFIRVLDEFDITIGTFQHILEGYKVADAMAEHGAMGSAFSDWWAYKFEVYDAIPYAGALMHEAGVVVSFNSDDRELARHLNTEAAKAIKYGGLSPEEALKFVTLNPAKQLRIDEYVGSLEAGKHADFVVWFGSPLSTTSRCEQTWIDGRQYFDYTQSQVVAARNDSMRNSLIQKILKTGQDMKDPDAEPDDPEQLWPRDDMFCGVHGFQD
ncbi:amidohydrolase family protein [Thalassoglobus sp. JC818]|uniref:amidohydrolase family protein n=1 Tax=Thalassoglobus sp. JC818 TaxID=3232136 RepID=UPI0034596805